MLSCSGRVGQGEAEHQRAQELRLAGAGGADHQAVRPHALLRGLLEVQVDRRPAVAETDRHPQPVARGPGAPGGRRVVPADVAEPEQVHEVRRTGDLAGAGRLGLDPAVTTCSGASRRASGLGGREVALVGRRADRGLAQSQRADRRPAVVESRRRPRRAAAAGCCPPARPTASAGRARSCRADRRAGSLVAGRSSAPSTTNEDWGRAASPRSGGQRAEQAQLGQAGGDHPARSDGVGVLTGQGVGEPLHPVPLGQRLLRREDGDREVLRATGTSPPSRSSRGRARAPPPRPRRSRSGRTPGGPRPPADSAAPGGRRAAGAGRRRRPGRPGRSAAESGGTSSSESGWLHTPYRTWRNSGVGDGVLPDARPFLGQGRQGRRVGVLPEQRGSLLRGGVAGDLPDRAEVAEVLRARRR